MEKTRTEITEADHPEFAPFLKTTAVSLIQHEDETFEWFCRKGNGSWLNGFDFTTKVGALNACYQRLAQDHPFVEAHAAISSAIPARGIPAPKGDLAKYLKKWEKKHTA